MKSNKIMLLLGIIASITGSSLISKDPAAVKRSYINIELYFNPDYAGIGLNDGVTSIDLGTIAKLRTIGALKKKLDLDHVMPGAADIITSNKDIKPLPDNTSISNYREDLRAFTKPAYDAYVKYEEEGKSSK